MIYVIVRSGLDVHKELTCNVYYTDEDEVRIIANRLNQIDDDYQYEVVTLEEST